MKRSILIILVASRKGSAVNVQKVLTGWGCLIKTRLGIHDGVLNKCSDSGLIILELVGEARKKRELNRKLSILPGVKTRYIEI